MYARSLRTVKNAVRRATTLALQARAATPVRTPMLQSDGPADAWLTPQSRDALGVVAALAEQTSNDRLRAIARQVCEDVRSRGGGITDAVVAVKSAWAVTPRSAPVAGYDAERLSRFVSLCIDEYYGAQG